MCIGHHIWKSKHIKKSCWLIETEQCNFFFRFVKCMPPLSTHSKILTVALWLMFNGKTYWCYESSFHGNFEGCDGLKCCAWCWLNNVALPCEKNKENGDMVSCCYHFKNHVNWTCTTISFDQDDKSQKETLLRHCALALKFKTFTMSGKHNTTGKQMLKTEEMACGCLSHQTCHHGSIDYLFLLFSKGKLLCLSSWCPSGMHCINDVCPVVTTILKSMVVENDIDLS